jgi:membrane protease YdiL (CAAX protease family)
MTDGAARARRITLLIGLALTLGSVLLHGNQFGERFLGMSKLASRDLFWWPLLIIMLLYVPLVERRPYASIGLRLPTWKTLVLGVGAAVLIVYGINPVSAWIVSWLHLQDGGAAAQTIQDTPLWYRTLLITRGSIVEEVVFRGYMIERIEELTGSRIVAGAVSLAAFVYAHMALWGWAPLVFVTLAGLVSTLLYLWRRDLVLLIIAHWLTDAVPVLWS